MNDLNPDELQNSSWVRSTRSSVAAASSACWWTASTKGFRTTAGFTVEIVPLKWTRMPWPSVPIWAEYFSSETWIEGMRAANEGLLDMGSSSEIGEARRPDRALRLDGDAARGAPADPDVHLRLEADAREPEPAPRRRGLLLHGPQVVAERVLLPVHRVDALAEGEVL